MSTWVEGPVTFVVVDLKGKEEWGEDIGVGGL
jgi:hypothetical protein